MDYEIEGGPVFTSVKVKLAQGEKVRGESGSMISMSSTVGLAIKKAAKGIFGSLKSSIGGESFFASEFTAEEGDGNVVFAPSVPGDIKAFEMTGQTLCFQNGAYLAGSSEGIELGTKGSLKTMLMGEGLFLQTITGSGTVFVSSYGNIMEHDLGSGEKMKVDNGNFLGFEESVSYTIRKAGKGLLSSFVSGEGLVIEFTGPGKVWVQSRSLSGLAGALAKFLSKKSG